MKPWRGAGVHRLVDALHALPRPRRAPLAAGAVLAALATLAAPAPAAAELLASHDGVAEGGCDLAVTLDGPLARVSETHRLTGGDQPSLARYQFALDDGAVVDGFEVTPSGGRREPGVVVAAASLTGGVPPVDLPPDLGLLYRLDGPAYEARIYPVPAHGTVAFTIAWSVPLTYEGGRMTLIVPARGGSGDALASCRVRVATRAGGGVVAWSQVYAMGEPAGGGRVVLARPDRDLIVEAVPRWAGTAPIVAARTADVGGGTTALVAGIYVPDQAGSARFAPRRLVVMVDASRSLLPAGRRAAATLTRTVLAQAPAGIPIEVVLFDRSVQRVLGWARNSAEARDRAAAAVLAAPPAAGTDLAGALAAVRDLIVDDGARIAIITDGILPTDQTGAELLGHLVHGAHRPGVDGPDVDGPDVDVIVPVVPGAVAPARGPLDQLAEAFHGRVVAVRSDDLPDGPTLIRRLGAGLPLEQPRLHAGGIALDTALPDTIEPGHGVVVTAAGTGLAGRATVTGVRGGADLRVKSVPLPAGAERFAVAAALTPDAVDSFALARRHHLVGPTAALVALDRRGRAARLRRDLAAETGLFDRIPSPFEPPLDAVEPRAAVPEIHVGRATAAGELPRRSVELAIRQQLVPRLHACYRQLLQRTRSGAGTLEVELEVARGEVMAVRFAGDAFPAEMIECAADAAFALTTPDYALGDEPDTIYVVRKPVTFQLAPTAGAPAAPPTGAPTGATIGVDPDAPL